MKGVSKRAIDNKGNFISSRIKRAISKSPRKRAIWVTSFMATFSVNPFNVPLLPFGVIENRSRD